MGEAPRPFMVGKSQQVPRSDRPKLDVGPFVKSDDHTAAGRDRELRAHSGRSRVSVVGRVSRDTSRSRTAAYWKSNELPVSGHS
jgi:hypothetical protein